MIKNDQSQPQAKASPVQPASIARYLAMLAAPVEHGHRPVVKALPTSSNHKLPSGSKWFWKRIAQVSESFMIFQRVSCWRQPSDAAFVLANQGVALQEQKPNLNWWAVRLCNVQSHCFLSCLKQWDSVGMLCDAQAGHANGAKLATCDQKGTGGSVGTRGRWRRATSGPEKQWSNATKQIKMIKSSSGPRSLELTHHWNWEETSTG